MVQGCLGILKYETGLLRPFWVLPERTTKTKHNAYPLETLYAEPLDLISLTPSSRVAPETASTYGFPKTGGTFFWGVTKTRDYGILKRYWGPLFGDPKIRIMAFCKLYWVPPILGNYLCAVVSCLVLATSRLASC